MEAQEPMRLKDGDTVMIGGSELRVGIVNVEDEEH
jgi:predicted component of type VI protein secretion system